MNSHAGGNYALKFISGKYTGGEFPIRPAQPVLIGRASELEIVLVEDMVSRKHAKITLSDGKILLEDLGSTNGTYVNGEKVQAAILREGDRILIGTSIFKVARMSQEPVVDNAEAKAQLAKAAAVNSARITKTGIMGKLEEVSLPDLLQLFHSSKKTGVLVVRSHREGRVYMRQGHVYHAAIVGHPGISPRKSFARMVTWLEGDFELLGAEETQFPNELEETIESLLMESFRQHDEFRRLDDGTLPPLLSVLSISRPLGPPLHVLNKELLDAFQLIYNHGVFQLVLDHSEEEDTRCAQSVLELIRRGYVSLS